MNKSDLKSLNLPENPGVYFFIGAKDEVLYIGKATSLKSRVRSYFTDGLEEKRSEIIRMMVNEAVRIDWRELDSVLESLIVETNLIRTHKPRYNTKSKDDKSYVRVIFTNEEWPRILLVREREVYETFTDKEIKYDFGPYTSAPLLRQALKIIQRIFRFYDTKDPVEQKHSKLRRGQIDFNRQIGLYPTEDESGKAEYQKTIKHLKLFFEGRKHDIIRELEKEMMSEAKAERFEAANLVKRKINALKHIDDISLIKRDTVDEVFASTFRVEAYDISHHSGKEMVGVMTVVDRGQVQKQEYRRFKIKNFKLANDPGALSEVIERRLEHTEWQLPQLFVVDGNEVQRQVVEKSLAKRGLKVPVVAVVKNDKHKVERILAEPEILSQYQYDIVLANSEAHRFALSYHHLLQRKKLRQ